MIMVMTAGSPATSGACLCVPVRALSLIIWPTYRHNEYYQLGVARMLDRRR